MVHVMVLVMSLIALVPTIVYASETRITQNSSKKPLPVPPVKASGVQLRAVKQPSQPFRAKKNYRDMNKYLETEVLEDYSEEFHAELERMGQTQELLPDTCDEEVEQEHVAVYESAAINESEIMRLETDLVSAMGTRNPPLLLTPAVPVISRQALATNDRETMLAAQRAYTAQRVQQKKMAAPLAVKAHAAPTKVARNAIAAETHSVAASASAGRKKAKPKNVLDKLINKVKPQRHEGNAQISLPANPKKGFTWDPDIDTDPLRKFKKVFWNCCDEIELRCPIAFNDEVWSIVWNKFLESKSAELRDSERSISNEVARQDDVLKKEFLSFLVHQIGGGIRLDDELEDPEAETA